MIIEVTTHNLKLLECFSSETRIRIIELMNEHPMNIKDLAEALQISSAIVTKHVQKLEEAGILVSENVKGKRGMQKICRLALDQLTLQLRSSKADDTSLAVTIPIGQYSAFEVKPTCGLASTEKLIGYVDDARYFADPEHVKASHLWFSSGYVEYQIPNFLLQHQHPTSLQIALELCSEAPGYNENWPSDITFKVNQVEIGTWTCPGDFGENKGAYTPSWWTMGTQHGLLKTLTIHEGGTYMDGIQLSNTTLSDLDLRYGKEITFTIGVSEQAKHCGGVSIFGRGFGNYNQDIQAVLSFS